MSSWAVAGGVTDVSAAAAEVVVTLLVGAAERSVAAGDVIGSDDLVVLAVFPQPAIAKPAIANEELTTSTRTIGTG